MDYNLYRLAREEFELRNRSLRPVYDSDPLETIPQPGRLSRLAGELLRMIGNRLEALGERLEYGHSRPVDGQTHRHSYS